MHDDTPRKAGTAHVVGWLAFPAVVFALYMALVWAPEERTLGSCSAFFTSTSGPPGMRIWPFSIVFVVSIAYLVRRRATLDAMAVAAAEIGIVFTVLTLVTGTFWARAVWNVWWTWDPR